MRRQRSQPALAEVERAETTCEKGASFKWSKEGVTHVGQRYGTVWTDMMDVSLTLSVYSAYVVRLRGMFPSIYAGFCKAQSMLSGFFILTRT